jgi:predicted enzyme related to lactoylglutathione lyase
MGPTPVDGVGDIAMFSDPDGNVIGLLTEAESGP